MIITMGFEALKEAMGTISSIVENKNINEDSKNVVIWHKEGVTRFSAYNGNVVGATPVESTIVGAPEGEELFIQLKAKDINDVIDSFKGLTRTVVSSVRFEVKDDKAIMHVFEKASEDVEEENAEEYAQESKFRINKPRLQQIVRNSIREINTEAEGVTIPSDIMLEYIGALLPTVAKEVRDSTSHVMFGNDLLYTLTGAYGTVMPNKLGVVVDAPVEAVSGFRLKNTVVSFIKGFIANSESFTLLKEDKGVGSVLLTLRVGGSVAVIKCPDMSRAYNMTNYAITPENEPKNGVVIDKMYFVDVLKRMSLGDAETQVEISIVEGEGQMKVLSKTMNQMIPVIQTKGEGVFSFKMKSELLSNVILSHLRGFGDKVFMYLEQNPSNNKLVLVVRDDTSLWQTKIDGLTSSRDSFAWT